MSKKQKPEPVFARDMKAKDRAEMINPKPVYSLTVNGKKRFRLKGASAIGTKMSLMVSEERAKQFGTPKEEQVKPRAAKKSCQEKFDECVAKKPAARARKAPAGDKAPAKRGRKPKTAEVEVEEKVEEAVVEAEKAVKKMKTAKKKASSKVEKAAEELVEAAEDLKDAVEASPKKAPAKKPAAKKAPAKKPAAKKAPTKKPAAKKAPAKKPAAKKAPAKKK